MRKNVLIKFEDGAKVQTIIDDGILEGGTYIYSLNGDKNYPDECADYYSNIDILIDWLVDNTQKDSKKYKK